MIIPNLVSIVITVFNRADLLRQAVASALDQTYRPIEILIVDDGSTDDTPAVANALATEHLEITVVRRPNGGPGLARETGRQHARGAFVQYLDSDDLLLPRKLEVQVAALNTHPQAGAAYGLTRYRDATGREIPCSWKDANQKQELLFPSLLVARWWETVTPLFRRSVTDAAGPWTDLRLEEDWEYDARIGALGTRLAFVPEVVAEHRDHAEERLSRGSSLDPVRLRWRRRAHELIFEHARRAGVPHDLPEMGHFARELFFLARQCGAAGLATDSAALFALAREASGPDRDRLQFRVYGAVAHIIGWVGIGKLAAKADGLRGRKSLT